MLGAFLVSTAPRGGAEVGGGVVGSVPMASRVGTAMPFTAGQWAQYRSISEARPPELVQRPERGVGTDAQLSWSAFLAAWRCRPLLPPQLPPTPTGSGPGSPHCLLGGSCVGCSPRSRPPWLVAAEQDSQGPGPLDSQALFPCTGHSRLRCFRQPT